jgi:hypothetical protein
VWLGVSNFKSKKYTENYMPSTLYYCLVYDSTEADSKGISEEINTLSIALCIHLGKSMYMVCCIDKEEKKFPFLLYYSAKKKESFILSSDKRMRNYIKQATNLSLLYYYNLVIHTYAKI